MRAMECSAATLQKRLWAPNEFRNEVDGAYPLQTGANDLLLDDLRLNKLKIQNSVRIVRPEEYVFSQTTRCARIVMYPG